MHQSFRWFHSCAPTPDAQEALQAHRREWNRQLKPFFDKKKTTNGWRSKADCQEIAKIYRSLRPFGEDCFHTTHPDDLPDFEDWRRLCPTYHNLVNKAGSVNSNMWAARCVHPPHSKNPRVALPEWCREGSVSSVSLDQTRKGLETVVLLQFEQPKEKWLIFKCVERAQQLPILQTHRYQVRLLVLQLANRQLLQAVAPQHSRFRKHRGEFPAGCVLKEVNLLLMFSSHPHHALFEEFVHKTLRQEIGNTKFLASFPGGPSKYKGDEEVDHRGEIYELKHLAYVQQKMKTLATLRLEELQEQDARFQRERERERAKRLFTSNTELGPGMTARAEPPVRDFCILRFHSPPCCLFRGTLYCASWTFRRKLTDLAKKRERAFTWRHYFWHRQVIAFALKSWRIEI